MKTTSIDIFRISATLSDLQSFLLQGFFIWLLIAFLCATSIAAGPHLEWTKTFDFSQSDGINGIAADGNGNMYICGGTYASLFAPNPNGSNSAFIAKYDVNGTLLWGNQRLASNTFSITTDASGSVYVGEANAVQKFNSSGVLQWTTATGNSSEISNTSVTVDKSGNILAGGYIGIYRGNTYDADTHLAKISPTGTLLWTQSFGNTGTNDYGCKVATDSQGNAFLAGFVDYGGSSWWENGFVAKFDPVGNMVWNKQIGPAGIPNIWAEANCLTIDSNDNIYIGGVADQSLYGESFSDGGYLMKWDTSGNRQSIFRLGGSVSGLAIAPSGGQYVLTDWEGLSEFNSNGAQLWNISPGNYQATGFAVSNNRIWVIGNSSTRSGSDFNISCIVVPEPSTFILFGIGTICLLGYIWRRKHEV